MVLDLPTPTGFAGSRFSRVISDPQRRKMKAMWWVFIKLNLLRNLLVLILSFFPFNVKSSFLC